MDVTYKKLWKLLIDKTMKKRDLQDVARISAGTMSFVVCWIVILLT